MKLSFIVHPCKVQRKYVNLPTRITYYDKKYITHHKLEPTTLGCYGKQERKSNDIITKIAPKPHVPSGTKAMDEFKYEKKVEWMGATYTIRIHRFADKSLSTVSDEDGRKYYDNKFQVQILRSDGSSFYDRTLTKDDFREFTDNQYAKNGALIGFMFDRAEGNKLYFGASVGSPDPKSDEYVPLDVTIDNMSRMRINKATQLDTPSDQPEQPKSEVDKSEEEGV